MRGACGCGLGLALPAHLVRGREHGHEGGRAQLATPHLVAESDNIRLTAVRTKLHAHDMEPKSLKTAESFEGEQFHMPPGHMSQVLKSHA
jgi:hypothetical protein